MTWRPLPPAPRQEEPHRLGASLDEVARGLGAPPVPVLEAVFSRWAEMVGPALAAHAHPASLTARSLVVVVDHPAWATEVRWLAPGLLARLAEIAGEQVAEAVEVRVARR